MSLVCFGCFRHCSILFRYKVSQCSPYIKLCLIMEGREEGNVLFNDTLNTFFIYGYMVKDSEIGSMWLLFPINSKSSFYALSQSQVRTYHGLCYTSHRELTGTRNSSTMRD